MRWRIYYADGSTFSDLDGDPFSAPPAGAQVISHTDAAVGRYFVAQRDFYWFEDDRWFGGDMAGLLLHLLEPGPRKVVFGKFVANEVYNACIQRAIDDPDFPPKSARHPEETY